MGSYVEGTLIKDEKIIYEGKTSIWSLLPLIVLGFILAQFALSKDEATRGWQKRALRQD